MVIFIRIMDTQRYMRLKQILQWPHYTLFHTFKTTKALPVLCLMKK